MTKTSFRSDLRRLRPNAAAESKTHAQKRKLALALRALRKEKGMTQKDIERNSTLTQPAISRLEAPTGSLPSWDTVMRYIEACNGHMLLGFSAHEFDEAAFVASQPKDGEPVVALAV